MDGGSFVSLLFHRLRRAAEGVVCSGVVLARKLFLDFSRLGGGVWLCNGCLWSVACLVLSIWLATALLMSGGAIPARTYTLCIFVDLRHPVIFLQLVLSTESSLLACPDRSHAGQAYSAAEKLSDRAVVLNVDALAPHLVFVSLLRMLFRVLTLALVLSTWDLNVRQRSKVTPRYTGFGQYGRRVPHHVMFSW